MVNKIQHQKYDPHAIESFWFEQWTRHHYEQPRGDGDPYCMMLPPPNVTGSLHMGHGFQQTLMDVLIRYQRMNGKKTLWQGGTDHAGIATQMLIEKQLAQQGQTRHDLGREPFLAKVWQWRDQSGDRILSQMQRLGVSMNWESRCFTMDPGMSRATYEAFIRLYDEGLIYRGKKLVNWDPQLGTALSDLEVEIEECAGSLWFIRYHFVHSEAYIVVATTRPETLFGDVAVAVHPEDPRYQQYVGQLLQLPFTGRTIPMIADAAVEPAFGTGCVKITPAHDFNDYEMGKRHALPLINIFTPEACINENGPEAYRGLDRYQAREKIISELRTRGWLDKIEKYQVSLPKGDRSGVVVEPYLTDQWFVKAKALAEPAIAAVREGRIALVPKNWEKTYLQWLDHIEDWCISRQLWWGHRIPIWYDLEGRQYTGLDLNDVRKRYHLNDNLVLHQDTDVLDTWFSASLWPFATLGWPEQTERLQCYFPTQVLVTGFDIIFFWVARMVMMSLKLTGQVPFQAVYITGLIRDSQGHKMSKTKGNVLDPIDLIDGITLEALIQKRTADLMQPQMKAKIEAATRREFPTGIQSYGTDALRFTFCALATTGRDINFDMGRIEGYRYFCNKIWNATRYVLMHTGDRPIDPDHGTPQYTCIDRWIRSRLQHLIQQVHHYIQIYRFDLLAHGLYEFVWHEYCDWYLELVKADSIGMSDTTSSTLIHVLDNILRLLHPIMPFITEELWQQLGLHQKNNRADSIMIADFPSCDPAAIDVSAETAIAWLQKKVVGIRTLRSEMHISPNQFIRMAWHSENAIDQEYMQQFEGAIKTLAKISEISFLEDTQHATKIVVDYLEIYIWHTAVIDKITQCTRLNREIKKIMDELEKSQRKLNNSEYIAKAPAPVVLQERERVAQRQLTLMQLQAQLSILEQMP